MPLYLLLWVWWKRAQVAGEELGARSCPVGSGGRAAAVSPARGSGSAGTPMGWKGVKPALRNRRIGPKLSTELSRGFLELPAILLSVCLQPPLIPRGAPSTLQA